MINKDLNNNNDIWAIFSILTHSLTSVYHICDIVDYPYMCTSWLPINCC